MTTSSLFANSLRLLCSLTLGFNCGKKHLFMSEAWRWEMSALIGDQLETMSWRCCGTLWIIVFQDFWSVRSHSFNRHVNKFLSKHWESFSCREIKWDLKAHKCWFDWWHQPGWHPGPHVLSRRKKWQMIKRAKLQYFSIMIFLNVIPQIAPKRILLAECCMCKKRWKMEKTNNNLCNFPWNIVGSSRPKIKYKSHQSDIKAYLDRSMQDTYFKSLELFKIRNSSSDKMTSLPRPGAFCPSEVAY